MLDQLIESRNHLSEAKRRGGFLLSTFTMVFAVFTIGIIYSLFNSNLALASSGLDISTLVSPVSVPAEVPEPPPRERVFEPKQQNSPKANEKFETRVENIQSADESPIKPPESVSAVKNTNLSRPKGEFSIGPEDSLNNSANTGDAANGRLGGRGNENGNRDGIEIKPPVNSEPAEKDAPPVIKQAAPKPTPVVVPAVVSGGVVNGKAINLVKPPFPAPAKIARASGTVTVQVFIDEDGNVKSASAVSGHPLLRQVSEQAARASKFSPTFLSQQKVKVTGVIVYNFVAQ